MKITFNQLNAVDNIITNDEALRQGNVGANNLIAEFEGKSNVEYTAVFNYTRSDGTKIQNVQMLEGNQSNQFKYKFNNPWFFALAGETTLTVYLRKNGVVIASGQITFDIEETDVETDSTITYTEYQELLDAIAGKQDKYSAYNVRCYATLSVAEDELENLVVGQIVYISETNSHYRVVENDDVKSFVVLENVIELSTGTSGTLTADQLNKLNDETTIIQNGFAFRLFYKQNETRETKTFRSNRILETDSDKWSINIRQIQIVLEDGTWEFSNYLSYFYNKYHIDSELDKKVEKIASGVSYPFAYGRNNLNQEAVHLIDTNDSDMTAGKLAKRNTRGSVSVPTPTSDNDSANKKYIDDSILSLGTGVRIKGSASVSQLNNASLVKVAGDMYNISDSGVLSDGNISVVAGDNVVWTANNVWDKFYGSIDVSDFARQLGYIGDYSTIGDILDEAGLNKQFLISFETENSIGIFYESENETFLHISNAYGEYTFVELDLTDSVDNIYDYLETNFATDNSINIASLTGTLSDANYDRATQNNAYLVYRESGTGAPIYYRKDSENADTIIFKLNPFLSSVLNTDTNENDLYINEKSIVITKATKGYANSDNAQKVYTPAQVEEKLAGKQNALTFDNAPTQNSTNPVTSGGVYTAISNIKKNAYKKVDYTLYPTLADFLATTGEEGYSYLYPIDTTDLTKGYYQYIWEVDNNVGSWVDMGSTQIDLTNYVTTNTDQTITGEKTHTGAKSKYKYQESSTTVWSIYSDEYNSLRIDNGNTKMFGIGANDVSVRLLLPVSNNTYNLGSSSRAWKDLYLSGSIYIASYQVANVDSSNRLNLLYNGNVKIKIGNAETIFVCSIGADSDNAYDIGVSSRRWRDLYLSGSIKDGTYSLSLADIFGVLFGKYVADNTITELPYETISEISIGANTTFTLKTAPTGCYPEYRAIITNSGANAIDLTFTGIAKIITNDSSIAVSGNVLTLPTATTIEISIENGHLVAINFGA